MLSIKILSFKKKNAPIQILLWFGGVSAQKNSTAQGRESLLLMQKITYISLYLQMLPVLQEDQTTLHLSTLDLITPTDYNWITGIDNTDLKSQSM